MADTIVSTAPSSPQLRGERRVVTILFADIVNSTGLAEKLDPEDWTELMNGAFERLTGPVNRYGGTVGRLMGDGMLAFFGAPQAHEDDPQRAVLAGLEIVAAIRDYRTSAKLPADGFDVRVGINTGSVVVADVGSSSITEHTAMGDAVNVAARMQQTAAPGTVQITAETCRLIGTDFEVEPLGRIELKGKSEPVSAFRVSRANADALPRGRKVLSPLVGRDIELRLLKSAADDVLQGRGRIVSIIGEAGLGKTRLLAELKDYWTTKQPPESWETMVGIPYDSSRPFGVFQNYARRIFGVQLDDDDATIHQKVRQSYLSRGAPEEAFAMCAVAMERVIAARVLHEARDYTGTEIKDDIYANLYPAIASTANGRPLVVVFDDLQWSDEASADLLIHLLPLAEEIKVLLILAFRPERQSPAWRVKQVAETNLPHRYEEIVLRPLDESASGELVGSLLKVDGLPADVRDAIIHKTEGNPYFVEEVVRSLVDQGVVQDRDGKLEWVKGKTAAQITIPDSLQALLVSRMDRLDQETRATLQMASVIGRSFYYRVLLAISASAMEVDKHLRSLERFELLREAGRRPELEYIFKHELCRDAAYGTILNRKRREFHLHVAEAIEKLFADRLPEQAHRLAQHFEAAGDEVRAARYYEMAADTAAAVGAFAETTALYERALITAEKGGADAATAERLHAKLADVAKV